MINVFISYGHNDYDHVARRIVEDLRARGLDVFFDVDCLELDDWEQLITQAIERCDYFIFCVSQKSISRDGYCLNELSRACELKKTCIPLMLDESFVPLSITRLQRLFFNRCCNLEKTIIEEVYEPSLQKLVKILTGQETLGFYNKDIVIEDQLQTFDPYEIVQNSLDFEGRDAFFKDFEEWLNNPSALPLYLLEAAPGVGKTAMASALATRYTASVAGIHFCLSGYFVAYGYSIVSFIHNVASIILARVPLSYIFSVNFPDTLFPMGLAAPIGSLLSVLICIGFLIWFRKHGKL